MILEHSQFVFLSGESECEKSYVDVKGKFMNNIYFWHNTQQLTKISLGIVLRA